MELKKEIFTALQLCFYLYILYRSFTWNLPTNFDDFAERNDALRRKNPSTKQEVVDLYPKGFSQTWNKHSIVMDSFKSVKSVSEKALRISTSTKKYLPPFYTWMQEELSKQNADSIQTKQHDKMVSSRRKLNYASSKCGAKILSSNSEAKYPFFILNEKVDEYMLNPCRASVWFVIELCDTIEVTQVELANYELYSSSPKKFAVFWNDIYPTQRWRHLGTFQAKDQRSVQSFNVTAQNLGKFIKVIIYDHHGREHYCPLSVFRVVGYSMISVYDHSETDDTHQQKSAGHDMLSKEVNKLSPFENKFSVVAKSNGDKRIHHQHLPRLNKPKIRQMQLKYCHLTSKTNERNICLNRPSCLFFKIIAQKTKQINCKSRVKCPKPFPISKLNKEENHFLNNLQVCKVTDSNASKNTAFKSEVNSPPFDLIRNLKNNRISSGDKSLTEEQLKTEKENLTRYSDRNQDQNNISTNYHRKESKRNVKDEILNSKINNHKEIVPNFILVEEKSNSKDENVESAALIQKESVLAKLKARIKSSETSLSLINRYLQQLSESYRYQMEDMQMMFNGTLKAIAMASEKAAEIDEKQQISIDALEEKMATLNSRTEHFINGHNYLLKRVFELHGLFLILEIIILSTIVSVYMNNFKQKKFITRNGLIGT